MKEITNENFKTTLESNSIVVFDFWAPWCGPCKMLSPVLDELEQELQGVEIPRKTVDLGPQHISKDGTHYYMATREVAREASREARSISDAKVYRTQLMHFLSHYPNRFDSPTLKVRYAKLPPEKKVKLMEKIIEILGRSPRWDTDNN